MFCGHEDLEEYLRMKNGEKFVDLPVKNQNLTRIKNRKTTSKRDWSWQDKVYFQFNSVYII